MTRGQRNHNPCNVRHGSKWKGLSVIQSDPQFCQFNSDYYGVRAAMIVLHTYVTKHKLQTIPDIIRRWAPQKDGNNTDSYINTVCGAMRKLFGIDKVIITVKCFKQGHPYYHDVLYVLMSAMCQIESKYILKRELFNEVLTDTFIKSKRRCPNSLTL